MSKSLSRILNDEASAAAAPPVGLPQSTPFAIDPALMELSAPAPVPPVPLQPPPPPPPPPHTGPASPHSLPPHQYFYHHPPPTQQHPGYQFPSHEQYWDQYSGQWVDPYHHQPHLPQHPYPHELPIHLRPEYRAPPQNVPIPVLRPEDQILDGRKRRKVAGDGEDFERRGSMRHPPSKIRRPSAPAAQSPAPRPSTPPPALPDPEEQRRIEEEARLASSDLEDCEEVWMGELGRYMLETRVRAKEIEAWFERKCAERSTEVAQFAAHRYHGRLAKAKALEQSREAENALLLSSYDMRELEPISPPPIPMDDESFGYDNHTNDDGASWQQPPYEDSDAAARELEESLLEEPSKKPQKRSAKDKDKKPAPATRRKRARTNTKAAEESVTEIEEPAASPAKKKPAAKRRKVEPQEDQMDAAEELERSVEQAPEPPQPTPPPVKPKRTRNRSKKQPPAASAAEEVEAEGAGGQASASTAPDAAAAANNASSLAASAELEALAEEKPPDPVLKTKKKAGPRKRKGAANAIAATAAGAADSGASTPKPGEGETSSGAATSMTSAALMMLVDAAATPSLPVIANLMHPTSPRSVGHSAPGSPSWTGFLPLDEPIPEQKRPKKMDPNSLARRAIALEEAQRKVWLNIAKKDIPRVYKYTSAGYQAKMAHHRKLSTLILLQSKKVATRTNKSGKDVQVKAKRLMREMLVFWRKNDKEERDIRKKAEKEAMDKAKHEEEKREAQRQARKLEFLITQTELYSHFVGNKLKTSEHEETAETAGAPKPPPPAAAVGDENEEEMGSAELDDLDFNDEDNTNLHRHARRNAKEAIELARQRAQAFDVAAAEDRKKNEAIARAKDGDDSEEAGSSAPLVDLDSEELNFQNPTSMGEPMVVSQPKMLMAQLKEYQLKGLNWLATLYEQGINGILADEMGLGKTVQSISLLAYLAETHDIWGPFLVIAPASTLHNWQQEITRFVPALKALPYWGNVKDRATLRKFWNKKQISYNQDAPFHVLITSYQLVVQDEKYFQRVKWQYMVLDEAQAIKSSTSARWKTLLGFNCRNRLLLTGTPIQNSMQELWALLHFIMPSLFDSHDEFSEWFSKDIENHAENKGSNLNEHQLRRLHMILKPFMLRRVKKHVQNELGDKIEIDMYCDLSPRQRALYRGLRNNVSVAELLAKAANLSDADSAMSLMNLVMQFRKVCNHPELFERADVTAPLAFSTFGQALGKIRDGDVLYCPYSTRNPIEFSIPELFYRDGGLLDVPGETSPVGPDTRWLGNLMNIWSNDWIEKSLESSASAFSFLPLLDISPAEAHTLYTAPPIRRLLMASQEDAKLQSDGPYLFDPDFAVSQTGPFGQISTRRISHLLDVADGSSPLSAISTDAWTASYLSRSEIRWFSEPVAAPPIGMYCRDRTFVDRQARICESYLDSLGLFGLPPSLKESPEAFKRTQALLPGLPPTGIVGSSSADQLPLSSMQVPEAKRLIYDSAKLARLDLLLQELKQGDHRVLIYFQMTRMIDLMEEYLIYRQYKYLRLDGSSKLEDRRDMVTDWQTRPDIFIFLLSTRAGGLGINLTAADTVVFYDHDWNPSNDSQAMDRAHRLGQTRQVTVYRLITRGTIDERIVQLARVKKDVQDIVVGNKQFTDTTKPNEIVSLLLNDDELALANIPQDGAAVSTSEAKGNTGRAEGEDESASASLRDMWLDEGDEFFGHVVGAGSTNTPPEADGQLPASQPQQASGKKTAQAPGNKPRKSTGKRQSHKKKPGPATGDSLPTEL